jgi:transglutaminase-like putative cysteine protease
VNGHARVLDGVLAAVATLATTLPVTTLFAPTAAWVRPSVLLVVVVAVTGMAVRALTSVRVVVVAAQLLALVHGTAILHGQGHLWNSLVPVPETGRALGVLLGEAYTTVTTYSVPAPANRGTVLGISVLVGLTALAVDALAVTWRSPALAGIPLLTAFLGSATNTGDGLAAWYVVPPALAWLAMVGGQGVRSLRSWGLSPARTEEGGDPVSSFATAGRVAGVFALAAAVLLPGVVPHLPPTFLAEGLGRNDEGRGGGSSVRLSSSIDIARDLADRSNDAVLVYRTSDPAPPPLRVGILDSYQRGRWTSTQDFTYVPIDGNLPGPAADPFVPRTTERLEVTTNRVGIPQVALPANATGSPFPAGSWHVTINGVAELTDPVSEYTVDYLSLEPAEGDFTTDLALDAPERDDLALDPRADPEVRALLAELTTPGDSPIEIARAIQDYLRGPDFTYSEDLAGDTADGQTPEEPLVRFLETKRGYCVQFASAMVMLSRTAGIPARMAVGFLPGIPDNGEWTVAVNDAHAWPELYFPRLGWIRFEPTPGGRSGAAPPYSLPPTEAGSGPTPTPSASASSSIGPDGRPEQDIDASGQGVGADTTTGGPARFVADHALTVMVVLIVLVLVALVPAGAWISRRRARRRSRDESERVEAEWESLVLRLGDIGVTASDGATPRQASAQLGKAAYLDADEGAALGRVVATLERARYARPGTSHVEDVGADARTVWRAALSRRRRLDQVRALLLPEEGLRWWRSVLRAPRDRRRDPHDGDGDAPPLG